jgi:hypothetical protein
MPLAAALSLPRSTRRSSYGVFPFRQTAGARAWAARCHQATTGVAMIVGMTIANMMPSKSKRIIFWADAMGPVDRAHLLRRRPAWSSPSSRIVCTLARAAPARSRARPSPQQNVWLLQPIREIFTATTPDRARYADYRAFRHCWTIQSGGRPKFPRHRADGHSGRTASPRDSVDGPIRGAAALRKASSSHVCGQ